MSSSLGAGKQTWSGGKRSREQFSYRMRVQEDVRTPSQSLHSVGNEKDDDKDNGVIVLSPILQNSDKFIRQNWPGAPRKFL